ncbi:MAG: 50S ribosomal protein L9, partial [Eubacteriales bacterium]
VIEVNNGYANNFILPKNLGIEATNKNMNDLKLQNANKDKVAQEQLEVAKELGALLETKEVIVKMKTGEGGRSFGTISSKEIATASKEQLQIELDKKKIQIQEPIKSLGVHIVAIKLHPKVTAKLTVKVQEEK